MRLKFAVEPLADCWDEIIPLASAHWHETMTWYRTKQPFAPNFERYNEYDKNGWMITVTVRDPDEDNKLVGHGILYIVPSMHTQKKICTEDVMFLLPEYRRGRNALRFYEFAEQELIRRGAVEVLATAQPKTGAARILEHIGFTLVNYQYSKHLEQAHV